MQLEKSWLTAVYFLFIFLDYSKLTAVLATGMNPKLYSKTTFIKFGGYCI
jgi:hypothetical protein